LTLAAVHWQEGPGNQENEANEPDFLHATSNSVQEPLVRLFPPFLQRVQQSICGTWIEHDDWLHGGFFELLRGFIRHLQSYK
jgi:hypothetical protein